MSTCFVQLGRFGDICNILPLVWEKAQTGQRPYLMVGRDGDTDFFTLLDGVSYCTALRWDGDWTDLAGAVKHAESIGFDEILVTQIYSKNYPHRRDTDSFCKEAWAQIGRTDWGSLPLIFDNRSTARETALREQYAGSGKPLIILSTHGHSSPFIQGNELENIIRKEFEGRHTIVSCTVPAPRFFDLLGLFDVASCLVSIDTGHLHLAHASKVPVLALVTDRPTLWHGCPAYPRQRWRCRYSEWPQRKGELIDAMLMAMKPEPQRRLIHMYCEYGRDEDAQRRHNIARGTWVREYATGHWIECPYRVSRDTRTSATMGDPRPVPYIRDMVAAALKGEESRNLIVLTNDDVSFAPGLTDTLLNLRHECAWSHRYDFSNIDRPVSTIGLAIGNKYPGADFFAFTKDWWDKQEFPDMLIGRQRWDLVVMTAMKLFGGIELSCATAHEQHQSFWRSGNNENQNPGNRHNLIMAQRWHQEHGIPMQ